MSIVHILRPGENLVLLAEFYGFRAWETIADAPENADLIARRKGPHGLEAGDEVHVPDPQLGARKYATGKEHRAVVRTTKPLLEVRVYTEFRRVPEGVAAGTKNGTIRGWIRGGSVPALPVRDATISIGPGGSRSGTTDSRGRIRVEALADGQWNLRLEPHADQLSPGPALPDTSRDHGLDWGKGNVPRSADGRKDGQYELEYRPLDLVLFVFGGVITSVGVVSPKRGDRPFHAVCFWEDVDPGGKGVSQVLEIDLKPDFLRKLHKDGVRPRTQKRPTPEDSKVYPEIFEIHHTGGNLISGAIAQFTLGKSKSGIHFLNDRDGHVVRMADDQHEVRHGGGTAGSVACAWDDKSNINGRALGVENVQGKNAKDDENEQPFTKAQVTSLIGLVRAARDAYGIPIWSVIGHGDVYTGKSRTCPGPMFPWKLLEDASAAVRPQPLEDHHIATMFGGFFAGDEGKSRALLAGDVDHADKASSWSLLRGNKVVASGLSKGPVQQLHRYLHYLGYVPNRSGRAPAVWTKWRDLADVHLFGRGTTASIECFKGHYGTLERRFVSNKAVVDFDLARLIYGCFVFLSSLGAKPEVL